MARDPRLRPSARGQRSVPGEAANAAGAPAPGDATACRHGDAGEHDRVEDGQAADHRRLPAAVLGRRERQAADAYHAAGRGVDLPDLAAGGRWFESDWTRSRWTGRDADLPLRTPRAKGPDGGPALPLPCRVVPSQ